MLINQKQIQIINEALDRGFIIHESPYRAWCPHIYEIPHTEWKISFEEPTPLFYPSRHNDRHYDITNLPSYSKNKTKATLIKEIKSLFENYIKEGN